MTPIDEIAAPQFLPASNKYAFPPFIPLSLLLPKIVSSMRISNKAIITINIKAKVDHWRTSIQLQKFEVSFSKELDDLIAKLKRISEMMNPIS